MTKKENEGDLLASESKICFLLMFVIEGFKIVLKLEENDLI